MYQKLSELSGVSQSCIRNILNEKAMSTRINTAMHLVGALNMDAETITCEDLLKANKRSKCIKRNLDHYNNF